MNRFLISAAVVGILAAGLLALGGTSDAVSLGGSSADNTINQLRADGYNVQLNVNGARDVPLSQCTVSGVEGLPITSPVDGAVATQFTTVYVDVDCPPGN